MRVLSSIGRVHRSSSPSLALIKQFRPLQFNIRSFSTSSTTSSTAATSSTFAHQHEKVLSQLHLWNPSTPVAECVTLPSSYYTHPLLHESEQRLIFHSSWQLIAHTSQLAQPGDFVSGIVSGSNKSNCNKSFEPFLCSRDEQNRIQCFYNVCSHHAMTVEPRQSGRALQGEFTCKYHNWKYHLNGRLKSASRMKGITQFKASAQGLKRIRTVVIEPFVYVNLSIDPDTDDSNADLIDSLKPLRAIHTHLAQTNINRLTPLTGRRFTTELKCNWKVVVDNFLDGGFHLQSAHPSLTKELNMASYQTQLFDRYSIQSTESAAAPSTVAQPSPSPSDKQASRVSDGKASYVWAFPNLMFNRYGPFLDTNIVQPLTYDTCAVHIDYYVDRELIKQQLMRERQSTDDQSLSEADVDASIASSIASSCRIQDEDIELCESVQCGLESSSYVSGRYSPHIEHAMHQFHQILHQKLHQISNSLQSNVKV